MKLLYASLATLLLVVLLDGTTAGRGGPGGPGGHHRRPKFCEVTDQTCPSCPDFLSCEDATPPRRCNFTEAVVKTCQPIDCRDDATLCVEPTECYANGFCGPPQISCDDDRPCPTGYTCHTRRNVCHPDRPTESCRPDLNCSGRPGRRGP